MIFTKIDFDTWERRDYFLHYDQQVNCFHSTTANIDVTDLMKVIRKHNFNFFRTFIYIVSRAVNSIPNYKIGLDEHNNLGFYDFISPSYLLFHQDTKTFSCASTEYDNDFALFYKRITGDYEKYKDVHGLFVTDIPRNTFDTSCIPWVKYTGFELNLPIQNKHYAPIITWGKYGKERRKILMPLTLSINHAVADGYHVGLLFNEIQNICDKFRESI